ncbi:choice-of-anchor D domain-containing protein [Gimesia sp.]|uniref:golvesin C-terminal-like domain-containing protein n=1 Tax=Gimesia sp. TaxID=2024833 RepID=UPI003A925B25
MLLTNWLTKLTSRISKRRVFRSRDRRDIRRRWQTIIHNQISTTEALEDRTLLTTFFVDDDFTGASDFSGTDTDPGAGGDQNAVWGVTAFATIQDALGFVADGDTIMVAAGIYNETGTMVIDDEISIIGEGKEVVEIRKAGAPGSSFDEVISITANNVTISGAQLGWETHTAATDYLGYVVTTVADNTTLNNLLFSDNYRSAVVFQNADNLEVSDSIFEGTYGRAAIRDGNGGSGENFLITRNEFREDHYRWGPIAIGPQGTFGDPNNFAFSGEISYNYFANGLEAGAFQEEGDQNYTVTITNQGMTVDGLNIIHNTFDWQDSATVNQVGNYAQSAGVYIDPGLSTPGPVNISDNIFTGFTYEGPQPSTDPLWGAAGQFGTALEFDGVDDYGFFESALFDVGAAGTLNFWINMHDTSRRNMFFEGLEGIGFEFQYREDDGGQFYGSPERDVSSNNYVIQDGAAALPNVWQNLQYTWDFNGGVNPQMHIYIDGVEVGYLSGTYDSDLSQWVATVNTATQLITVGKDASGGRFFDGLMDDIGWFNAALDGTDRDNIRNNGVAALSADPRLVAHWDFDEVAGTTAVDNKNGIVMYIVADGIAPFGPEFQETGGQFGGALEFDGIDDFATFQDATFDVGETGTLNFWVNMQDQSRRNQFFEGLDDLGFEFQYRENSGGQFFGSPGREGNGENVAIQNGGAGGTEGVWQNLQYTWDYNGGVSPQIHIYVDGTEVGYLSTSYDSDLSGWVNIVSSVNRLVTVGMDAGGGRYFDGLMDDVAWFDEVLSTGELAEIRGTSVGTSSLNGDSRLVAYWNLDDASGTTVASGNGGTNIDLLIQQKPALPPVQGVGVIAPSGVNLTNNIFTGNDLDSNLTLDPSNQTGTLDLLYAKDSDPLFVPTDSLAEQYRVGFGSPAAYMSSDIEIDPATPFPHIGAYQGFPGYYGTGDILIYGTNDNDLLNITFTAEDEATFTFTRDVGGPGEFTEGPVILTGITSFTFFGLEGDDTLRITNPAGGLVNPVNGITFNGGTGGEVDGDTLEILGGTATSVLHTFDNANDGSVSFNGEATATITYTGLEPVLDTIVAGDRTFNFTGGAETITLSDVGPNNDGISQIDSDVLGELVNFLNPTDNIFINTEIGAVAGADIVTISGLDTLFDANLTVTAGTDDTINTGTVDIGSGALDLTGGQVNVDGSFTTTGSVDIEATAADITFAAAGSIDAGTSEIDLTASSDVTSLNVTTTSEVRVTATNGGINDLTGNALITADRVALRAGTGGITGIETNVNTLAASAADGSFSIDNTGDLEIGTVDSLNGITANSSQLFVTATGALNVNQSVSAETIGYLRAIDAVGAGQDINVNAGVTTTVGNLNLQAGDNLNLATGITLDAAAAMILNIDNLSADVGGGIANLNGVLTAGTDITVNGGIGADQVIIDSNAGTASDGGTVDGVQSLFNFVGGGGADELILDDSGDASGDLISISNTGPGLGAVSGAGLAALSFSFASPATVTLNTGTDTNSINVELGNGSPDVNITSAGGADSLTVLGRVAGDDLLVATPGAIGTGSGTIQDLGFPKTIDFDGITGPILIDGRGSALNDLVTVLGTAAVDTTTIGPSGPVLLVEIDPTLVTIRVQSIDVLAVDTGDSEDVIEVSPDLNIAIDINGGDPTAPATPGDQLTYLTPSGEGSNYTPTGTDSGTITATGGFQIVTFDEIETVTLGGSVTVTGTAADDVLTITATSANAGTYQIVSGGVPGPVININSITDFTFNGGDGDDVLIIDNSLIVPTAGSDLFNPVNGITFNGQGNTAVGDSLQILGGDATTVEHQFLNNNDGYVFYDGESTATITYTGLEPVLDTTVANDRTFSFLGGAETITLSDDVDFLPSPVAGQSQIDSDLFGEYVAFLNPTDNLIINTEASGGSGADSVQIEGLDADFNANLTVNAGTDDSVTFQTNTTDVDTGNLDINAGSIVLNAAVTTSGDVALDATNGSISGTSLVTATNATLAATVDAGGLGTELNLDVDSLEANVTGSLYVDNTGALNIGFAGGINGVQVGATSTITSTGTMTVTENVTATGGDLLLQNTGGDFILNALAIISNNSTFEIGIDSAGAVTLADTSTVTSSGTGLIDIDAVNNIELTNVNTSGEVQVTTSAGAITDISGSEAALITADTVALRAATGIGATGAADIDLAVNTLAADTTAGDIYIQEPSLSEVDTVNGLSGIKAAGDINLNVGAMNTYQDIEATGAASTISVLNAGDLSIGAGVITNGGQIDILSNNNLFLTTSSLVDTTTAAIVNVIANADATGSGSVHHTSGGVVNAHGGYLTVSGLFLWIADLQSVGGTVAVTATGGYIHDTNGTESPVITADEAVLSALDGIGSAGTGDIDTAVGTLSASTTNNDIVISNTGALIIGDVAPLSGVTSTNGAVTVSASSPLTVSSNVTAAGTVTLTATDSPAATDDLTIDPGVTVESTGADVVLNAGDNFLLFLGGEVIASTTIEINVDPIAGDPDADGGVVVLFGNVNATQTTINGGDDADAFNILPTSTSPITINGGAPAFPGPGDVLNMDFSGLASSPFLTLGAAPGSGAFGFVAPDTEEIVDFTGIENVASSGAYHLVLDMFFSGFQNTAADEIDATVDGTGTNLLLDINGGNFFTGAVADILSFTTVGSTDDETLNINENATGGLPFFQVAAPAVTGSAGSHLNASANTYLDATYPPAYTVNDITIHYDGGAGTDSVNVNFTTDHNAAYFTDIIDAAGSGNITSSTIAGTDIDLGLSFARLEGVGFSGTAAGELRVDASSNSFTNNIAINDDGTPADGISQIAGNMQFTDVLFEGFSDLQVLSGTGAELLDLIGLDSTTSLTNVVLNASDISGTDTGNDTIRVRSTPAGTVTNVSVSGGLGDDLIQIFDGGNTVDNIFAAIQVFGQGGTDTLTLTDSGAGTGDTFEVTSTTIEGISSSPGTDVTFTDIDALNVTGTGGNDTINVNLGAQLDLNTVTINGSGGDDTFNLNNSTPVGVDTRLNGNAGLDEFIFLASNVLRGFVNGGADVDTIDYSGYTPVVHVALSGIGSVDGFQGRENNGSILGTGVASLAFDNIDDLVGTAGVDTLEGPDLRNYWGITSTDEGFIIADRVALAIGRPTTPADATATPPEERLDFTSFQNLIGGSQDDRFDLTDGAGLTGTLNGDSGNDSLDYRDFTTAVTVDLFAGTATNIGGGLVAGTGGGDDDNSIENVFGGNGNDNITGDNDNNILGDGLGSDFLDGGGDGVGSGNGGNDVFLMEPGAGGSADVITDIHGNDTVDFRFASAGIVFDVDIINTPQDVFGGNTVELRQIQPEQPDTNPSFMENVVGSQFDDYIYIDPLSQDGNFPIDGPPVLRSADGQGGTDFLDFDAKGQEVIDTGFSLTADGVGTVQYLNFENITPFEDNPAFIVDNGDPGFTITGDWPYHPPGIAITNGIGFEDDIHSVAGLDPYGTGPAQAFWEFFGLTPGEYRVSVTWPESSNPFAATDAPFTVYDGARTEIGGSALDLGTYDVNQQLTPDDYSAAGTTWEILDTFTVNSRTLTVMLTNLADGLITADAIRIERVSAGPEIELVDVTDALAPPALIVDGHPDGIQFGPTELLTDAVRTFEITNNGSAVLNISNISLPAGYTTDLTAQAIGIGSTISFTITMGSTTFGDRSGIFSFDTDDVDESTFNILLDGQVSNVVIIDDGDSDFSATAGFESFNTRVNEGSYGYEGDVSGAVPNDPGNTPAPATETATWTFTGLAEGNYRVSTTWSQLFNRVTDAPFSLDGGAGTLDIDVDQSVAPSSFVENGTAWFDLSSSFSVSAAGDLVVTLTNEASNFIRDNYDLANGVIADAIRIEYLPEPDLEITVDGGTVVDDDTGVVDFGSTIAGIPVIKEFTITNLSTTEAVIVTGLIAFPPGFSIVPTSPFGTDAVSVPIAANSSVTFSIQFDGGTNGTTFGQISFTTGDDDENPFNFTVRGEAGPATVEITDPDFSTTGTWEGYTPGNVGDPQFLTAGEEFVTGTGANTATWEFDVEPGRYQVVAHWYVNPDVTMNGHGAAPNAPYTINGGAAPVTVLVNQQISSNDFLDDGIYWEYIGNPVEIIGNSLIVELTDLADGLVYADEIRIYRVVDPVIDVQVDGDTLADGDTVNFDDTIVGAPVVKTFTVTNYGERNMALAPINVPAGFSLVSGFGSTNLAPGASTTFALQMDAGSAGSFSGVVSFGVDSSDANPFNFTVTGSASETMIIDNGDIGYSTTGDWIPRYATSIYDYYENDQDELPSDNLPGTSTATWDFTNLAAGTYSISSHWAAHSGLASNAQFLISGIQGGDITVSLDQRFAANDFTDAGVNWETLGTFQVAAGGNFTITLLDDGGPGKLAADAMRLDLLPSGTVAPEIEVQAGAVNLTSGSSSLNLGTAFYGESLFQTFTITNTGTDTLNLGAVIPPAAPGFSISVPLGTTTLFAGQSTTFEVEFNNTTVAGLSSGTLTIPNDDADEAPFTIGLSATMDPSLIVDDGDAGFSSTGGFYATSWLSYFQLDTRQLNTGDNGTATWDFSSLPAGSYTVYATWSAHGSLATNAEYSINAVGPIVINQRVAPNDLTSDGANWEILGVVNVLAGGSISVVLEDNAADGRIRADAIRIERTGPLMAAGGASTSSAPAITQSDLDSVRDAALNYWKATGLSETQISLLESVSFVLADLPDAMLGGATTTTILIDINAAGYGWFVDDTPFDSSEFSLDADGDLVAGIGSDAFGQMDLLTVMLHEMGHTLGYDHLDEDSLMGETLDASERRLPEIDDFFSGVAEGDNPLLD